MELPFRGSRNRPGDTGPQLLREHERPESDRSGKSRKTTWRFLPTFLDSLKGPTKGPRSCAAFPYQGTEPVSATAKNRPPKGSVGAGSGPGADHVPPGRFQGVPDNAAARRTPGNVDIIARFLGVVGYGVPYPIHGVSLRPIPFRARDPRFPGAEPASDPVRPAAQSEYRSSRRESASRRE